MDVLGVGEEGDPWKTPKRRWNAAEMKIRARRALGNGGFWWRWRVEVELWYGRWLKEMKEKVSHVCSQNNRRVEWSQHKYFIRNFKSYHYNKWVALFIGTWPAKWRENVTKMKCKCSLEKKLDCRPCDVVDESWWCQVTYHTLLAQVTRTMLPSHSPCLVHVLLASKWRVTQVILGQR